MNKVLLKSWGRKGLSLGSVVLGVTIFIIIITAVFALAITAFRAVALARENTEAIFLAREGLEIVRDIKGYSLDHFQAMLESKDFQNINTFSMAKGGYFKVGRATNTKSWLVEQLSADAIFDDYQLYMTPNGILTLLDAGGIDKSRYARRIKIDFLDKNLVVATIPTDIARVKSKIEWHSTFGTRSVVLTELLTKQNN